MGENLGYISDCYARGAVSGDDSVGGLVGDNTYYPIVYGEIETSYSTGLVSGEENVGGFVYRGNDAATTSDDCFWDIETSGHITSDGGIGKTTAEMQTAGTFTSGVWTNVNKFEQSGGQFNLDELNNTGSHDLYIHDTADCRINVLNADAVGVLLQDGNLRGQWTPPGFLLWDLRKGRDAKRKSRLPPRRKYRANKE